MNTTSTESIAPLRITINEAAQALRCSRGLIYKRVREGKLRIVKDGSASYIVPEELRRYAESLERSAA